MEKKVLRSTLISCASGGEYSDVELVADTGTGETQLVISKTIIERYPITDYEKVMKLHEDLNAGGGRKVFKLKDLI